MIYINGITRDSVDVWEMNILKVDILTLRLLNLFY